ncbi:MAG: hypothetical protein KA003_14040 [Caldilineaceae bacterium]|nr:hypothetical protein [Caldilineaceae bacterium]MBP8109047.1 hypothetical protein [Caldilineaceae bacterium]MBP8122030.1 hypothetical protein [Caldilineaceae bacterium]
MPQPIKTGLLCVPALDDEALAAVGNTLRARVAGCVVMLERSVGGQRHALEDILVRWCDEEELDLVITLGGTLPAPGPSGREVTPEVTLAVLERTLPGFAEAMRAYAQEQTALALLDRGVVGIRGRTLVINLPAGAAPGVLFLEAVVDLIPAVLAYLREDEDRPRMEDELILHHEDETQALPQSGAQAMGKGLDAAEFADFLRRKRA